MPYTTKPDGRTFSVGRHFDGVAQHYRGLRDLDEASIRRVGQMVANLTRPGAQLRTLDVGAGTGRYTEAVLAKVAADYRFGCTAVAYDANRTMLASPLAATEGPAVPMARVVGLAETLPFRDAAFDAALSFNALHHFDLSILLAEAARVVRPEGGLILYTRTPQQNQRTIWGQFFPHFADRETRLYTESTLRTALGAATDFELIEMREMPWRIRTSLPRLLAQARSGGYSTFRFYSPGELKEALSAFENRVRATFDDPSAITTQNDHLLVLARRR